MLVVALLSMRRLLPGLARDGTLPAHRRWSAMRKVRWERMFPDQLEAAFAACPLVYFAYGLCEPHGPPDFGATQPGFAGDGKSGGDHAGRVETSLLWALDPGCVDVSRLPEPGAAGPHFAMGANAREADRRIGERMVADEVGWLGEKGRELLAEVGRERARHRPRTFREVE